MAHDPPGAYRNYVSACGTSDVIGESVDPAGPRAALDWDFLMVKPALVRGPAIELCLGLRK